MVTWTPQRLKRTLLVGVLLLLIYLALYAARGALFPYILALVLAYLLVPAVSGLETVLRRFLRLGAAARPLSILVVYLLLIGLVAWFFSIVVPVLVQEMGALWDSRDALAARAEGLAERGLTWYRQNVPPELQAQIEDNLRRTSGTVVGALQIGVTRTFGVVTSTVSWLLGLAVIPFWLFYVLYDRGKAARSMRTLIPDRWWPDFRNLVRITDGVLGAYVRGQLVLSVAIGLMAFAGLVILGVPYAVLLGLLAGLFETLPFIGPILGAVPAVIVATFQDPLLGLWTALLFLGIQQIENTILAPRIAGNAVKLHPAIIMVVLVVGNEVAGLWGMLVAVPFTAVIRDVFRYLYLRLQDEPVPPDEAARRVTQAESWPVRREQSGQAVGPVELPEAEVGTPAGGTYAANGEPLAPVPVAAVASPGTERKPAGAEPAAAPHEADVGLAGAHATGDGAIEDKAEPAVAPMHGDGTDDGS